MQAIMEVGANFYEFQKRVNKLLEEGWKAVPNTMFIGSIEKVAGLGYPRATTQQNTFFEEKYVIFMERDNNK